MQAAKRENISSFASAVPFLLIFFVLLTRGAGDDHAPTTIITVNPSVRYQVMHGWEAAVTSTVWEDTRDVTAALPQVFDLVANDLGLNRVQLGIFAGLENPTDYWQQYYSGQIPLASFKGVRYQILNDNADPNVINPKGFQFSQLDYSLDHLIIPWRQRLQARGEQLYIILHYTDYGSPESSNNNNPIEHAELMLAVFQHIKQKYGFVPDAIEVIDEPDGTGWSGSQIGSAIVAVGSRLNANGFTPEFLGPSSSSISSAIDTFDELIQVPGVQPLFKELVYHRYGEGSIRAAAARGIQYDLRTAMLGCGGCDYTVLHDDIKNGRNSAWQQGVLTGNSNDGNIYIFIDKTNPLKPIAYMSTLTKLSRQYIKFIKRGSQRIGANSTSGTFDPLAFINPDGRYVVVTKAAASGGSFSMQNLPAGTYGIKYTTPSEYDVDLPDVMIAAGQSIDTSIPRDGVLTVYQKATTGNSPAAPPNLQVK